ncbi:hypothetical protein, partial [Klebsiella pneumoniae]|uniref:hypothetical protein n=1 Tax=Klebsiella pneumoniae TaxID=573 RepID=UPI00163D822C
RIVGDEYIDLIIEYKTNSQVLQLFSNATLHIMNDLFAVIHVDVEEFMAEITRIRYAEIPLVFGLTDRVSLDASRVLDLRNTAAFNLRGEGVVI